MRREFPFSGSLLGVCAQIVRTRSIKVLVATGLVLSLGTASSHAAVVTVGTPLPIPVEENIHIVCGQPGCLFTNPSAPSGLSDISPVDGVIIRWRLYGPISETGYRLRVLSPFGNEYLGAGTSASLPAAGTKVVSTFPTHLPVKAGQLIGLEIGGNAGFLFGTSPSVTSMALEPAPFDGESTTPSSAWGTGHYLFPFNADVLPPPSIVGISPAGGLFSSGTEVTISGDNFAEVESVTFGGEPVNFTVDSESRLTASVPPVPMPATVPVRVVTAAGTAKAPANFNYEGPSPSCVVPRLNGKSLSAVRKALRRHDCSLGRVRRRHHGTAKAGRVKHQSPRAGTVLSPGGEVGVTLGVIPAHTP
ncbi:MAG TPA: IPT/TIG domain-containing protein [Solirubrobacterales bacterium]|nr:IPT/TIG domain-containing protein [Solirubrobacterales bacterium]